MPSIRSRQFETFWGRICFFLVPIPPRVDLSRSKGTAQFLLSFGRQRIESSVGLRHCHQADACRLSGTRLCGGAK